MSLGHGSERMFVFLFWGGAKGEGGIVFVGRYSRWLLTSGEEDRLCVLLTAAPGHHGNAQGSAVLGC